ncbi:MAG: metalloregulator ArsR/SmtB family transcription factor [Candidatus Poribacteria bacterium]|nr:metalloregulator ArsR/SmtB family transcription factor [Candidatus Poribacteria bacterium]
MNNEALIKALKALAHETRFRIVQEIATAGELSCGQIGERFELAQPTISHHLKVLGDAGILTIRKDAQHHFVSVNRKQMNAIMELLPGRLALSDEKPGTQTTKTA